MIEFSIALIVFALAFIFTSLHRRARKYKEIKSRGRYNPEKDCVYFLHGPTFAGISHYEMVNAETGKSFSTYSPSDFYEKAADALREEGKAEIERIKRAEAARAQAGLNIKGEYR